MATQRCKHRHTFLEHPHCYERKPEKIGFFDIESSNLHADFGILLSYAIKELDGDIYGAVISPKELRSAKLDNGIVKKCIQDMRRFDKIITYYGTRFDLPFVRARAMLYGLDFPVYKEIKHTDVYYWARAKLCLHRRRLQTVCDFLGIPAKEHPMTPNQWTTALTGNRASLDYIFVHNKEDVVSLEEVYKRLIDFTANRANSI